MNVEKILAYYPEKRRAHIRGVIEESKKLAERYGADVEKAMTAALFHDIAKYRVKEWQDGAFPEVVLDEDTIEIPETIHAPLGAYLARKEFGIEDEEILHAIAGHTVGIVPMHKLDQILFLADLIEPGRDFPGVENLRAAAYADLTGATLLAMKHTIQYLMGQGLLVHPATIRAYNALIRQSR